MNPDQNNTRAGAFQVAASGAITRSHLVVLGNTSGSPVVKMPTVATEQPLYIADENAEAGVLLDVSPLTTNRQVRIPLVGTCNPGDVLVQADPTDAAKRGKVTKAGASPTGTRFTAEEAGIDGQLILCRLIGA